MSRIIEIIVTASLAPIPALAMANVVTAGSLTRYTECRWNQIRSDR